MASESLGEIEVLRGAVYVRDGGVAQAVEGIDLKSRSDLPFPEHGLDPVCADLIRGAPRRPTAFRVDNGPELTAEAFAEWCREREIEIRYIQPEKPDQNAYIERFNRSYRQDVLDAYVFSSLEEVRVVTEEWLRDYNTERLHDSLGRVPPLTFLPRPTSTREYSFNLST
jgi:transposase InsO family protein